jgi:hypothetical protein
MNFFKLVIEVAAGVTDVINLFGHGCHGALQARQGFAGLSIVSCVLGSRFAAV